MWSGDAGVVPWSVHWCALSLSLGFIGTTQLKVNSAAKMLQSYFEPRHPNGISTIADLHPEEFDNTKAVGWECDLQLTCSKESTFNQI